MAATEAAYRASLALECKTLRHLLDAERRLAADARAPIREAAEAGLVAAERALAAKPDDASAQLLVGLNVAMVGVGQGKIAAFMNGIPQRVLTAANRAIKLDQRIDCAGPLQLMGRFRSIVPWPYRDLKLARDALDEAVAIAPVKQSLFFLGDMHARLGDLDAARAAWNAALDAQPFPPAQRLAPLVDKLIERRLALAASPRR